MEYIIVQPQENLDSYTRAFGISRELYNITSPEELQKEYQKDCIVFPLILHPNNELWALIIESNYEIYVNNQTTLDKLISLFPIMDINEIESLSNFILTSDRILFGQIIPSDVIVRDENYMIENGWFM